MAIALSAITKKTIKINKIRAGRKSPGLAAQHLNGIFQILKQIFVFFKLFVFGSRHPIGSEHK